METGIADAPLCLIDLESRDELVDESAEEPSELLDRKDEIDRLRFGFSNLGPKGQIVICALEKELQQQPFIRAVLITALSQLGMSDLARQVIEESKPLTFNDLRRSDYRELLGIRQSEAESNYAQLEKAAGKAALTLFCLTQEQDPLAAAKLIWTGID
jgi:hypothetical protein